MKSVTIGLVVMPVVCFLQKVYWKCIYHFLMQAFVMKLKVLW